MVDERGGDRTLWLQDKQRFEELISLLFSHSFYFSTSVCINIPIPHPLLPLPPSLRSLLCARHMWGYPPPPPPKHSSTFVISNLLIHHETHVLGSMSQTQWNVGKNRSVAESDAEDAEYDVNVVVWISLDFCSERASNYDWNCLRS